MYATGGSKTDVEESQGSASVRLNQIFGATRLWQQTDGSCKDQTVKVNVNMTVFAQCCVKVISELFWRMTSNREISPLLLNSVAGR